VTDLLAEWGSEIISVAALLLSLYSINLTHQRDRREQEYRTRKDRETAALKLKANVTLEIVDHYPASKLLVTNHGQASARKIEIRLDGEYLQNHCSWPGNATFHSEVKPGETVSYLLGTANTCYPPFRWEARWSDASGASGLSEGVLTL
jgi:hypothetical protein